MARCKSYLVNIPRFYKFQTIDHIMFGYVHGLRRIVRTMSVSEAIRIFLDSFQIDEDNYCFDTAKMTYYRILNSIIEMSDSQNPDDKTVIGFEPLDK